jgi:hypothetical protein
MKQKYLFVGRIFSIALVFAMVLAGCEYNGPSVDEISDAVISKQKPGPTADDIADAVNGKQPTADDIADAVNGRQPTADDIADAVNGRQPTADDIADAVVGKQPGVDDIADTIMERQELSNYSSQMNNLASLGGLTIGKGIQAWGQTDATYTLAVNTAERQSFNLPSISVLTWEGNGTDDIKRTDSLITLAEKSNGKTTTFDFTIANTVDPAKPIKGTLTITTSYYGDTVGVVVLNEFFEKLLGYNDNYTNNIANFTLTTNTAITRWGQTTAVAYTITADIYDGETARIYSPNSAPVLFNQNNYNWDNASIEWKLPILGDVTAEMNNGSPSGYTYIGGNYLNFSNFSGTYYDLSTDSTTAKQAKFEFRITRGDQTISGTVTVNVKKVTKTPAQVEQEAEKAQLEQLRDSFTNRFNPNYYIVTRFIDKGITAFGQTDVLYTIAVRGRQEYSEWNSVTNDYDYYSYVNLPYVYGYDASDNWVNFLTWTTKTANAAVVLSGDSLKVYPGKTGAAEFSFTYTNPANKTVKGTVKVTVLK